MIEAHPGDEMVAMAEERGGVGELERAAGAVRIRGGAVDLARRLDAGPLSRSFPMLQHQRPPRRHQSRKPFRGAR